VSEIKPVRLQLSRKKGFDLQAQSRETNGLPAVFCARDSLWNNPFRIGEPSGWLFKDGGDPTPMIASVSREQSIAMFRTIVKNGFIEPEMHPDGHQWVDRFRARIGCSPAEWVYTLRGHNLACWCKATEACHCDVLLELADRQICEPIAPSPPVIEAGK